MIVTLPSDACTVALVIVKLSLSTSVSFFNTSIVTDVSSAVVSTSSVAMGPSLVPLIVIVIMWLSLPSAVLTSYVSTIFSPLVKP
ncbi:hypothetical protein VAT7223_03370 [Vibrio atlanticus]|uniref:Uncharacterized protein n=1 Tax=Vibrio atlanticus TaxID=693153 RepID=A0A1C3IZS8_9VIBR|nr:hypothetical protein VAT7223_03370 [Vibrio atlanticus]